MRCVTALCLCLFVVSAMVQVGCDGGELPGRKAGPPVWIESPAHGALVSAGAHDIVLVVHHSTDYELGEIRNQAALLDAARAALAELPGGAVSSKTALAVVAVGAKATMVQTLTTDRERWTSAMVDVSARRPVGTSPIEPGLQLALEELTGAHARRTALPLVIHAAQRGAPVSETLADALRASGIAAVHLGPEPDALWPADRPGAFHAAATEASDVAGLLLLAHNPLEIRIGVSSKRSVRVNLLDADGELLLDAEGEGPTFSVPFDLREGAGIRQLAVHAEVIGSDGEATARADTVEMPLMRAPFVTRVEPEMAVPGDTVVVTGRHFSPVEGNVLSLSDMLVEPLSQAKHRIEFVLPDGAPDGELRVLADDEPSAEVVFRVDADGDGLANNDEVSHGTDPYRSDSDADGVLDGDDMCPSQVEGAGSVDAVGCSLCDNAILDPGEGDVDCGGSCAPCEAGAPCESESDCDGGGCHDGQCLPTHCNSDELDGDEQDVDCGGTCAPCDDGARCGGADDCASGECVEGRCRPTHCVNGIADSTETDVDCGGACLPCAIDLGCARHADCSTRLCQDGTCRAPGCDDGVRDGEETDVDCGGVQCDACAPGSVCGANTDCDTGMCHGGICAGPGCDDAVRNGDETGVDCGGGCDPCAVGQDCGVDGDCVDGVCRDGVCLAATCSDGVANGGESDVDCAGPCDRCGLGAHCERSPDCESDTCQDGTCVQRLCVNGEQDEDESDVDCGGPCAPCAPGGHCGDGTDCTSHICGDDGRCTAPTCDDGVRNGDEGDIDCAGRCPFCAVGATCRSGGDCHSRVCTRGLCAEPSCDDGADNQDETDVDCGGSCPGCAFGQSCDGHGDCRNGECLDGRCTIPRCDDERLNQDETDVDCGGPNCGPCVAGGVCTRDIDCASEQCVDGLCVEPTCEDGTRNGAETGLDCGGGACEACEDGGGCASGFDCGSRVCRVVARVGACQPATCDDHVHNGDELDIDCGGGCGPCAAGMACHDAEDCQSGVCDRGEDDALGLCAAPRCDDGILNGAETHTDCGGMTCGRCAQGQGCGSAADCHSGVCFDSTCMAPACDDGVQNGGETAVDCGGDTNCVRCDDGAVCVAAEDCLSLVCNQSEPSGQGADGAVPIGPRCQAPSCFDEVRNGEEPDVDCGGPCPTPCPDDAACRMASDCHSGVCSGDLLTCLRPDCDDGVHNGEESAVDCGGACAGCETGQDCQNASDCASNICDGARCAENTCLDGIRSGTETDKDCGGHCGACADDARCERGADCVSRWCRLGQCTVPPSCETIAIADAAAPNGVYRLAPLGIDEPVDVLCDMTTDGGGWTLVSSSALTPTGDAAQSWSAELTTTSPDGPAAGVWDGLRAAVEDRPTDLRFSCRIDREEAALSTDLSFYDTDWYQTMTRGDDAASCFAVADAPVVVHPARRNNLDGDVRAAGTPWAQGPMVGEGSCDDEASFTVDFEDAGLDGNERDGTDWGLDDGLGKCGDQYTARGAWFIWLRETVHHCFDAELSGDETAVDCGGAACAPCPVPCEADETCDSGVCDRGLCALPACDDGIANGEETDVDCGGGCGPCGDGAVCLGDDDCESGRCAAERCRTMNCENEIRDEDETDVDCGGLCSPCALDQTCAIDADCNSGACVGEQCVEEPCRNEILDGSETDIDCGGLRCGPCAGGMACRRDEECESGRCDAAICRAISACDDLWQSENPRASGIYQLGEGPYWPVYCDMDTDGGGWTLVAASLGAPPADQASEHYRDLARTSPLAAHEGIWPGLRDALGPRSDIRFACRAEPSPAPPTVDLSFYGVPWYEEITRGTDEETCFNESTGLGFEYPAPQRRDNIANRVHPRGRGWQYELDGYLEGEDECASLDDFTVDFDDRGLDGDEADGTDWGLDDGIAKCGAPLDPIAQEQAAWWIWARRGMPACFDGNHNGDEAGPDCGGSCAVGCPEPQD